MTSGNGAQRRITLARANTAAPLRPLGLRRLQAAQPREGVAHLAPRYAFLPLRRSQPEPMSDNGSYGLHKNHSYRGSRS
jgi:hypothetical protein